MIFCVRFAEHTNSVSEISTILLLSRQSFYIQPNIDSPSALRSRYVTFARPLVPHHPSNLRPGDQQHTACIYCVPLSLRLTSDGYYFNVQIESGGNFCELDEDLTWSSRRRTWIRRCGTYKNERLLQLGNILQARGVMPIVREL